LTADSFPRSCATPDPPRLVADTGGHGNDTTVDWWWSGSGDSTALPTMSAKSTTSLARIRTSRDDSGINWAMILAVLASVADVAIVPLHYLLGPGSTARMNLSGPVSGTGKL
jgi:4-alpha-glucanotransferase